MNLKSIKYLIPGELSKAAKNQGNLFEEYSNLLAKYYILLEHKVWEKENLTYEKKRSLAEDIINERKSLPKKSDRSYMAGIAELVDLTSYAIPILYSFNVKDLSDAGFAGLSFLLMASFRMCMSESISSTSNFLKNEIGNLEKKLNSKTLNTTLD